jgi:hypothetical protein
LTEIGSKWPKEQKRRSKVRERKSLDREIEEDGSTRKMDLGKLSKQEKSNNGCFGAPCRKEGKITWQSLEDASQVGLGF